MLVPNTMALEHLHKISSITNSLLRVVDDSLEMPDTGERLTVLEGAASRTEQISQKGYRYRKGFWPYVINNEELQHKIATRNLLGMTEHPLDDAEFMCTPYDKASIICLSAICEESDPNQTPIVRLGILNTPAGNNIKALIAVGHKPGVSTRALGEYKTDDISQYLDEVTFRCLGWDVVRSPNFEDIRMDKVSDSLAQLPAFKELVQMYQLRDSVTDNYNVSKLREDIDAAKEYLQRISNNLKLL